MIKEKNSINRLIAEINVPSMEVAGLAQTNYSAFIKSELLPIIERVAGRLNTAGRLIRIDKLELDFGSFDPNGKNIKSLKTFETQIEEKLARLIQKGTALVHHTHEMVNQSISSTAKNSLTEEIKAQLPDEELLLFLLREGYLPWWVSAGENILLEDLAQAVLIQPSGIFKNTLIHLMQNAHVRARIAFKLSVKISEKVIQLISPFSGHTFQSINTLFAGSQLTQTEETMLRRFFYEFILRYHAQTVEPDFLLTHLLNNDSTIIPLPANIRMVAKKIQKSYQNSKTSIKEIQENNKKETEVSDSKKNTEIESIKNVVDEIPEQNAVISSASDEGKYYIKNAGIVIAFNYLPIFFEALGLIKDNQFVSAEAAERSVYLLQYLATGSRNHYEEHDLFFNKIVCGMPLKQVLLSDFEITAAEQDECQALLQAIVGNWTALGNTSAEGMRDAFFMRNGLIERQTNGWNLKIEKNTIDVLVDRLPWGISVIKLPWTDDIIFVDW